MQKESLIHKEKTHPILRAKRTLGQKTADFVTKAVGSWAFIITFFTFLLFWVGVNTFWILFENSLDPYPFIFLNLILSCVAAVQAPIILMSQNREAQRDRIRSEYDYEVNKKAEREIEEIKKQLDRIERKLR
jgi:uncharacterized membrane protein